MSNSSVLSQSPKAAYKIMYVINRLGEKEILDTNKIVARIIELINREPKIPNIQPYELMCGVVGKITNNIPTAQLDVYTASLCASMSVGNPYYGMLAARIAIDNHQKNTSRSFTDKIKRAYLNKICDDSAPLVSRAYKSYIEKNQDAIEIMIDYRRDFTLDYFGFETFRQLYSLKTSNESPDKSMVAFERPQDLFMRVAVQMHAMTCGNAEDELCLIKETYDYLSQKCISHATPSYFNACKPLNQLASCFLLDVEDSGESIMNTAKAMAAISKRGGGIGLSMSSVRERGALIRSSGGESGGLINWFAIFRWVMRGFNQGGMRPGSAAIYLEMHHPDMNEFLRIRIPGTVEFEMAQDIFPGLWIADLFMERVHRNEMWSFISPNTFDLSTLHGDAFRKKYLELERTAVKRINARELWDLIIKSMQLSGLPYICFKDTVNRFNAQSNIGIIKNSNLCTEIVEYSSTKETAVCVLGSVALSSCVSAHGFDFNKLEKLVCVLTRNLNNVIDKNSYPTDETKRSNNLHRPIGIGVQGLADVYIRLRMPFDSAEARDLNKKIFETIDYASLSESTRLARALHMRHKEECLARGAITLEQWHYKAKDDYECKFIEYKTPDLIPQISGAYASMEWQGGSFLRRRTTLSETKLVPQERPRTTFHWELYREARASAPESLAAMRKFWPAADLDTTIISKRYDWETLRAHIETFGLRNSLRVAIMPTASTSQLLGNNECIEPFTSNLYKRRTVAGQFIVVNKYLVEDLNQLGLWNDEIKDYLLQFDGSVQNIEGLPDNLKKIYRTAYELPQAALIQQAIDRQPFVDQAQSLNLYCREVERAECTKLIFYAWHGLLKTGKYYMHTRPATSPQKFTIDPRKQKEMLALTAPVTAAANTIDEEEKCLLCSS